jgi:hypothetical protein
MATFDQRKGDAAHAFNKAAPQISSQSVAIKPQAAPQLVRDSHAAKARLDLAQGARVNANAEAASTKRAAEVGAKLPNAPQLNAKAQDAARKLTAATQSAIKADAQAQESNKQAAAALRASKNNSNSFKR